MSAAMVTIPQATERLWGRDTRSLRVRTRIFLKLNDVPTFKDGKQFYIRSVDLRRFEGDD